jgi:hypothetical protein
MQEIKDTFKQLVVDAKMDLEEADRKAHYAEKHKDLKLVDLATRMREVEILDEYLENLGKYLHAEYDVIRLTLISEAMDKEGLQSPVNVAGIGRVGLAGDLYVSVGAAEPVEGKDYKGELFTWMRKNKCGSLITESINSSTLKAWVKERILKGKPYPTDLLKVTPFTRASITKVK